MDNKTGFTDKEAIEQFESLVIDGLDEEAALRTAAMNLVDKYLANLPTETKNQWPQRKPRLEQM